LPRFTARATRTHRPAALAGLIGQLYAERHFPAAQKARVNLIVRNVSAAFRRRVESVSWLSPASRKAALAKIDVVYFGVGYPERWPNYSSLVVNAADPIGNRMRLAEWNFRETVSRVGQPVDPAAWWITPQTPGAVLLFNQNAYNFAAALLQAPKYDANASDAVNYGAIGAIVGHELSHFVDTLGADYDAAGAKVRWWTPQDMAGYEAATAPLVRQYSNYSIPSGEHLDGQARAGRERRRSRGPVRRLRCLSADAGRPAKKRNTSASRTASSSPVTRAPGAANTRRRAAQQAATDHVPERFRIATVRNLDAWYEAFNVSPGQKLYLEPRARVRVW
jgi:predicted metalloendopeptidase